MQRIPSIEEQHLRGDNARLRVTLESSHHFSQPVWIGFGVIVEQNFNIGLGGAEPGITGAGESPVVIKGNETDVWVMVDHQGYGLILAGIVGHNDFKRAK